MLILYLTAATIPFSALALILPAPRRRYQNLIYASLAIISLALGILAALLVARVQQPAFVLLIIPIVIAGSLIIWAQRFRDDEEDLFVDTPLPGSGDNLPIDWEGFDRARGGWKGRVKV